MNKETINTILDRLTEQQFNEVFNIVDTMDDMNWMKEELLKKNQLIHNIYTKLDEWENDFYSGSFIKDEENIKELKNMIIEDETLGKLERILKGDDK